MRARIRSVNDKITYAAEVSTHNLQILFKSLMHRSQMQSVLRELLTEVC